MNFKNSLLSFGILGLVACQPSEPSYQTWLGKWAGPEGTYLDIKETNSQYLIIMSDLDGPKSFKGKVTGQGIAFTRNGQEEVIHAGTGPETGMKWLADKKNCLVVRTGEGFCRD